MVGHEDRRLLAVLDRLEGGADGHLGLAEAHVAAHEAVHGVLGLHVRLDVLDGLGLVGGQGVGERRLHLRLPGGVGAEGVARAVGAALVEDDQLLGDVGHRGADPGLGLGPLAAPEARQGRRVTTGVVADGVDLVGGDVEPVGPPVLQQQVVALDPADGPLDHPAVAGDAVVVVHDVVADLEVVEEAAAVTAAGTGAAMGAASTGEVGLGQHRHLDLREDAAPLQGLDDEVPARHAQVAAFAERQPVVGQQRGEAAGGAGAVRAQHHPVAVGEELAELADQQLAVAGDRRPAGRGHRGDVGALGRSGDRPHRRVAAGQQPLEGNVQGGEGGPAVPTPSPGTGRS